MRFKAFRHVGACILAAHPIQPALFCAEVETISTVETAPGVTQQYSLLFNDSSSIERVWVLFSGYDGYVHMGLLDGAATFIGRGILVDGRGLFLRDHNAVAVIDSPSSMREMSAAFRSSEPYLSGTEKLINSVQAKWPTAKIYLVGASNGSISVMRLATRMGTRIAGVVVLSGLYSDLAHLKGLNVSQPLVFVHHAKDGCIPPRFTPEFVDRFHPVIVEDIGVHYAGTCGPYSAHHFHGQEGAVIDLRYSWIEAKPLPRSIR